MKFNFRINSENVDTADYLFSELDSIRNLYNEFSNQSVKTQLSVFLDDILRRININIDSDEVLHYELESFFENEFGNQIQNKFTSNSSSFIEILGINSKKITFEEQPIFDGFNSKSNFYYDNVYFIESPIKLEDRNLMRFTNVLRDKNQHLNSKIFQPKKNKIFFLTLILILKNSMK